MRKVFAHLWALPSDSANKADTCAGNVTAPTHAKTTRSGTFNRRAAAPTSGPFVTSCVSYLERQKPWTPLTASWRKAHKYEDKIQRVSRGGRCVKVKSPTGGDGEIRWCCRQTQCRRGGKEKRLIGGKLQKRKSGPLQSCPLPSVLLLTEIASEAGPTKNSLDFTRTFRTIVFLRRLTFIGWTPQPIRGWFLITFPTALNFVSTVYRDLCQIKCRHCLLSLSHTHTPTHTHTYTTLHCGTICCQNPLKPALL